MSLHAPWWRVGGRGLDPELLLVVLLPASGALGVLYGGAVVQLLLRIAA
jgi:hypothetical protein